MGLELQPVGQSRPQRSKLRCDRELCKNPPQVIATFENTPTNGKFQHRPPRSEQQRKSLTEVKSVWKDFRPAKPSAILGPRCRYPQVQRHPPS